MSAIDQAFIKAFQRDQEPAVDPPEGVRRERRLRPPVKAPAPARQAAAPPPEDPYASGVWYRIEGAGDSVGTSEAPNDSTEPRPPSPATRNRSAQRPHVRFREESHEATEPTARRANTESPRTPMQQPPEPRPTFPHPDPEVAEPSIPTASNYSRAASPKFDSEVAPPASAPTRQAPAVAESQSSVGNLADTGFVSPVDLAAAFTVTIAGNWESELVLPAPTDRPARATPIATAPVRVDLPEPTAVAKPHFTLPAMEVETPRQPANPPVAKADEKVAESKPKAESPKPVEGKFATPEASPTASPIPSASALASEVVRVAENSPATAGNSLPDAAEPAAARPDFQPAWEVERFSWPTECEELLASAFDDWGLAVRQLLANAKRGAKTLAVAGLRRGEGRSTLALCLARLAAKMGAQIGLIDADFENPQLASLLGVGTECDWKQSLADGQPLEEASIICLADELTLVPLQSATPFKRVSFRQPAVTGLLKTAAAVFDLVLVDVGPIAAPEYTAVWGGKACPFDGVLLVRDLRRTDAEEIAATAAQLRKQGLPQVVVLENFAGQAAPIAATVH